MLEVGPRVIIATTISTVMIRSREPLRPRTATGRTNQPRPASGRPAAATSAPSLSAMGYRLYQSRLISATMISTWTGRRPQRPEPVTHGERHPSRNLATGDARCCEDLPDGLAGVAGVV